MAFTLISKTVKPTDVQWWREVDAEAATRLGDFVKSYPGVVSVDAKEPEPNVWQSVIVFENKAAFDGYKAATAKQSDFALRKAYHATHGITTTFQTQGE